MANYSRREFMTMFCFRLPGKVSGLGSALIFLSCVLAEPSAATTHWIVTEDGKIQQQVDSPLNLKHPHDLVIFMRQETRVSYLKELEKQLVAQKIHIEDNEDRDTGLEQRHYKEDVDCIKAKVPLGDLDLYDGTYISLESKDISPEDHVDHKSPLPPDLEKPDCANVLELPYSIHAFQHLRGVQERVNLTTPLLSQEDSIFSCMSQRVGRSMEEVGHRIHEALHLNSSSWVLYNMAAFYWRMKNEPRQVVECSMRALHFSPRQHKDIALVNMANVLHRAHFSADAAILVHTALDITSDLLTSHYTLGNIYAMLGEYNHSVLCYDHALQAKPGFEQALKRKHAVLCQQKLEQKLETQHRSLQRTLNELKEYQKQHDQYLRQQEALDKHKLGQEEQILRNIIHETQMAKEAQLGNHQLCRVGKPQGSLHCPYDLPVRYHRGDVFESVELIQFGEDRSTASSTSLISELSLNQSDGRVLFPSVSSAPLLGTFWGKEASSRDSQDILWPKRSDCARIFPSIPTPEELPTYFLPPENRGLGVQALLFQGQLPEVLPPPPDCSSVPGPPPRDSPASLGWGLEGRELPDHHARQLLLSRLDRPNLGEEQIGGLITRGLNQSGAPLWLVLNEAALFWRASGNASSALSCLHKALNYAPQEHLDIPLVNAANLLLHYGLYQEASQVLEKALAINRSEPLTLLSLGNVCLAQGNVSGAVSVFRQALSLGTRCPGCESSLRLIRCLQFYPFLYNLSSSLACKQGSCYSQEGAETQGSEPQREAGADRRESLGSEPLGDTGADRRESLGSEPLRDTGADRRESLGSEPLRDTGADRRESLGSEPLRDTGADRRDSLGSEPLGDTGADRRDSLGSDHLGDTGADRRESQGSEPLRDTGADRRESLALTKPHPGTGGDPLQFHSMMVLDSNGSGGALQRGGEVQRVEESEEEEKEEEEWQLKEDLIGAFEGALDVKGRRVDLQGIRVLKTGGGGGAEAGGRAGPCFGNCEEDDGAEWITFQVKRMRKPKADPSDLQVGSREREAGFHSALEISGPQIPSPGPPGRRRDYLSLGWPSPDECQRLRRVEPTTVASTWLAVSAKSIDITEHIDFATPLQEPAVEPICNANLPATMHTLDHLNGVANRGGIHYTGESQLQEVLQNLGKDKYSAQSFEQVGTRIAKVLEKNQTSWVLSSMAALYWRVKGQGKKAVDCLRQALNYAPHHMKDVPLISLANIFHNAKLWDDAITVASMAVEIAPHFVVNHFTLANVYIAMEEFEKAIQWYESTLKLQPEFAPAKDRLRSIQCHLLTKKEKRVP
ncbi:tetratricopeptide repeat protein 17-like isoform X2 [Polyodon spathula]|uniref:tetratricopeptide repeat protein 17-like isoform X2 n=1 Tax=Polyodon spathula TaxID=7913 RepID=UPI001B7E54C3|nr:tetratricopeptide repeat protein 17-like isoform X2 [Polyodon spathula]